MDQPTQRPAPLTEADADLIAERLTERLIDAVTNPHTVDRVTNAWAGSVDKMIGRGIRRLFGTVVLGLILFAAVKFELLGKFLGVK